MRVPSNPEWGREPENDGAGCRIATALVAAAAAGDARATEALVARFSGLVWSIAWSFHLSAPDAADVSQMVWLRLLENLGRIRQPASVGAWLASVTRHECLRVLRHRDREITTAESIDLDEYGGDDDIDLALLSQERGAALREAFACLPPKWRSLLEVLIGTPTASYEEVAKAVGMPIGSIGPTRQRCLERLRSSPVLVELSAA
jgi:RNA polymerase sigma factor (sigma-70 family)